MLLFLVPPAHERALFAGRNARFFSQSWVCLLPYHQRIVRFCAFFQIRLREILRAVIVPFSVDVMDDILFRESDSVVFLVGKSMFKDVSVPVAVGMLGRVDVDVPALVLPAPAFPSRIVRTSRAVRDAVALSKVHEVAGVLISLGDRLDHCAGCLPAAALTKTCWLLPVRWRLFVDTFNSHCFSLLSQVDYNMAT